MRNGRKLDNPLMGMPDPDHIFIDRSGEISLLSLMDFFFFFIIIKFEFHIQI